MFDPRKTLMRAHRIAMTLFRLMIPVILGVRLLQELGLIDGLSMLLAPAMELLGLPGETGLVWAVTLAINLFTGLAVLASLWPELSLSVAQVSVLASMMLLAHSLPVEARVAQRAGVNLGFTLTLRIGGAFVYGLLLYALYSAFDGQQEAARLLLQPAETDLSWTAWLWSQVKNLAMIYLVIQLLIFLLELLQRLGVIEWINRLLRPVLHGLGIGREAETLTLVGLTLGLSYGGALLIEEAEAGHVAPRDVLYAISLLGLSHSLIEDTLLMLLTGADLMALLPLRVLFTLAAIALLVRLTRNLPPQRLQRLVRLPAA